MSRVEREGEKERERERERERQQPCRTGARKPKRRSVSASIPRCCGVRASFAMLWSDKHPPLAPPPPSSCYLLPPPPSRSLTGSTERSLTRAAVPPPRPSRPHLTSPHLTSSPCGRKCGEISLRPRRTSSRLAVAPHTFPLASATSATSLSLSLSLCRSCLLCQLRCSRLSCSAAAAELSLAVLVAPLSPKDLEGRTVKFHSRRAGSLLSRFEGACSEPAVLFPQRRVNVRLSLSL